MRFMWLQWCIYCYKRKCYCSDRKNRAIDGYNGSLILKNNALFINCISKINNALIDNAEDLDIIMHEYNLIEYIKNYSKNLVLYGIKQEMFHVTLYITTSEYFKYMASITGKTAHDGNTKEVNFSVTLKHLSNFWRILDMPLISCEVSVTLTWSKNCVITDEATQDADANVNPPVPEIKVSAGAIFEITDTKLNVPVVTLSTQDDNKSLEQLKTGFRKKIKWNKYRSEMTKQTKTNNLNYLIEPTCSKFNRLFALWFNNEDDRISFLWVLCTKCWNKRLQCINRWQTFFWCSNKKRRNIWSKYWNE